MQMLEALDAGLFRFANQSLSNPIFDRLMPWLSGNVLFVPLVLLLAGWLIWKFRRRGLFCVILLTLLVPLGDSFVCNTLKKSIRRPRPYVTHSEAIQRGDKTSAYASMPSSHAANWFAATMIAWIYFRRSARYTLPLAVAVSFSRIYNGVHYPSDVLAGAILGAGYGFVGVFTLEAIWRWLGKKYFPVWLASAPSLVNSSDASAKGNAATSASKSELETHWLRAGYLLIIVLTLSRWAYLASGIIELSEDEAYQWHWSQNLALSYYSKPPLIAYTQSLSTLIWGNNTFGVRFCAPLIGGLLMTMLLRFFSKEVSARTGFLAMLILTATPLLGVGATLMTVDPLSVLFWTAAMMAGWKAIKPEGVTRDWLWAGLWMGLGFLSKYTALFQLLCWVAFFVLWKPARAHLRRPGPWLALLINAVCFLPVIVWNQQHDWITAKHVAMDNAALGKEWKFLEVLDDFLEFLGAEAVLLNPVFFVSAVWAACAFWKRHRQDPRLVYFFSMGAPVVLVYLGWAFHSRVLPNWIAPSVLPTFIVMVIYWEAQHHAGLRRVVPSLVSGTALGLIGVLLMCDTDLIRRACRHPSSGLAETLATIKIRNWFDKIDPLNRVRAWSSTARAVGEARERLLKEGKPVFIIGAHYGITSLVSFYLPEANAAAAAKQPFVYYQTTARPDNQFYFWPDYTMRKGENAIYVAQVHNPKPVPPQVASQFESITELPEQPVIYRGRVIRQLKLYECRNLR